jgi:hypothetical protein
VRDPVEKWNVKEQDTEIVDGGVDDKRLLVMEPEFANTLTLMEREGNTLSGASTRVSGFDRSRAYALPGTGI